MDGITFQKLRDLEARFAEVETRMSDPAVVQDPSAYQKLAREAKELGPIVERYRAYKDVLQELAKVQEMARAESDPELREMAHEESRALEARRDALDALIPVLLVPKDPNGTRLTDADSVSCRPREAFYLSGRIWQILSCRIPRDHIAFLHHARERRRPCPISRPPRAAPRAGHAPPDAG